MTGHATPEAGMFAGHWSLLFGVRRSVRCHVRREQYFDRAHHLGAFAAALAGAGEMAFGFTRKARRHSDLARDFIDLEKALVQAGDALPESRLRELEAVRLDIEAPKPPVLRALDVRCAMTSW